MVHEIDQGSDELAHICFNEIRLFINLGRKISQISGNNLIEISLFISLIKALQAFREQTECTADKYTSCFHSL